MAELITLLLYALATARMVRLIIKDKILDWPRDWWLTRAPEGSLRRYWISCTWCVSIGAAGLCTAPAYVLAPNHPAPRIVAAALTFSWLAVLAWDLQRLLEGKANLYNPPAPPAEQASQGTQEGGQ
jgi:hypothetical protein